jgi:hypothetical protein
MIDNIYSSFGAILGTAIVLFLMVLAMLWFLMPLILYQIKNRLDMLIIEAKEIRKYLEKPKPEKLWDPE